MAILGIQFLFWSSINRDTIHISNISSKNILVKFFKGFSKSFSRKSLKHPNLVLSFHFKSSLSFLTDTIFELPLSILDCRIMLLSFYDLEKITISCIVSFGVCDPIEFAG